MNNDKLTHVSLFSGIGGAELAASWAGFENVFHCELNPFGRQVLNYWFPTSVSYDDITRTDFTQWRRRINVLTGGFPCQPFSMAGRRKGADDDRYLWPQMLRAIREIEPDWVIGENVDGILSMVEPVDGAAMEGRAADVDAYLYTIERVCRDLEAAGYSVQPIVIPACAVGAPHRRDRVWIIGRRIDSPTDGGIYNPPSSTHPDLHGRTTQMGGDKDGAEVAIPDTSGDVAARHTQMDSVDKLRDEWRRRWASPPQSLILGVDDGLSDRMDALTIPFPQWREMTKKAMGNAWVPQVAYELFVAIKKEYK